MDNQRSGDDRAEEWSLSTQINRWVEWLIKPSLLFKFRTNDEMKKSWTDSVGHHRSSLIVVVMQSGRIFPHLLLWWPFCWRYKFTLKMTTTKSCLTVCGECEELISCLVQLADFFYSIICSPCLVVTVSHHLKSFICGVNRTLLWKSMASFPGSYTPWSTQ